MKLTVKRKVANGLVVGFLLPPVAGVVAEALDFDVEGMNAYAADDNFDITLAEEAAEALFVVEDPCDDGIDPSGVDTLCLQRAEGMPIVCVRETTTLTTDEDGATDFFEVYGDDPRDPSGTHIYYFESTRTYEAKPLTEAVVLAADSCVPHPVWVQGQNDGYVDGDSKYWIRVLDEYQEPLTYVNGVNIDNDYVDGATVNVWGPQWLRPGNNGHYTVILYNFGEEPITGYDLLIEPSPGLDINEFTVEGSGSFRGKAKLTRARGILLRNVSLDWDEDIQVFMEIELATGGQEDKVLRARLVGDGSDDENDDSLNVRASLR